MRDSPSVSNQRHAIILLVRMVGREIGSLALVFISSQLTFGMVWFWLRSPLGSPRGEVLQEYGLTAALYLPLAILISYILVRAFNHVGFFAPPKRHFWLAALIFGCLLGIFIAVLDRYFHVMAVLNPLLRVLGF